MERRRGGRGGGQESVMRRPAHDPRALPKSGAKWEKWEGTNGPPGTERARVWGGGGSGGGRDAPSKTSCRSKRRGYSRDGWSGAVVSWTSPVRRPRVGPGEESVCVESVGRTPTELTVDGPLEAVFSQGGRPSRGARGPLRGPMCVAFLFVASPSAPSAARAPCSVVLAVNRDEFFARSTRECHWWDDHPQIFAGRDAEAGGTWLGLTRDGRVAVLTNFTERDKIPDAPSRGELPVGFLAVRHRCVISSRRTTTGCPPERPIRPAWSHLQLPVLVPSSRRTPIVVPPRRTSPTSPHAATNTTGLTSSSATVARSSLPTSATAEQPPPKPRRRRSSLPTISTTARAGRCSG